MPTGGILASAIDCAARQIQAATKLRPKLAIILGSGFGHVLKAVKVEARISYSKIPGFPRVGVAGHAGELVCGHFEEVPVFILSGRAHFYEGHPMEAVTVAVRTMAACGVEDVLLTNAAGGLKKSMRPGDFMLIEDHINFMGDNPLRGPTLTGRARFVDLTEAYNFELRRLLQQAARQSRVRLQSGVYLAVSGPSYETPAEIRAFARLGADAVGMSTVPEAIVARQCGLRVAGVSCITNLAAGRAKKSLSHAEVLEVAQRCQLSAVKLLSAFVRNYAKTPQVRTR